jgi:hypothetical protein
MFVIAVIEEGAAGVPFELTIELPRDHPNPRDLFQRHRQQRRRFAMKMVILIAVLLLVPAMLCAQATMGVYFGYVPGLMVYDPTPFSFFDVFIYVHNSNVYVTAVEYQLQTPTDPGHVSLQISSVSYPENYSVSLGDPFNGHSITYWPPLDGWSPGYNELCKLECFTTEPCLDEGGTLIEYFMVIGPHPETGEIKGTYWPGNLPFPIIGLTSKVCPEEPVGVEEESWGAIKAMFGE